MCCVLVFITCDQQTVINAKMSRLATKIKSIFSFNSDTYDVHKAIEDELLTNPQPQPQPVSTVLVLNEGQPPVDVAERNRIENGARGGVGKQHQSSSSALVAYRASDKKQSRQRKVSGSDNDDDRVGRDGVGVVFV